MSTYIPLISKTTKAVDWLYDRGLEEADNAALAAYDRRCEIEQSVTFSDLVEEMADFTEPRAEVFMQAYRRGTAEEKHTMFVLIDQAFERIVERKLAEPDKPRFSVTYCSQCGKALGAGNNGVSHCYKHGGV